MISIIFRSWRFLPFAVHSTGRTTGAVVIMLQLACQKNQSPSKNPKAFPYVPFLLGDVFVFYLISLMAGLESSNRFRLMSVLTSVFLFHSEGICNNRMVDELPN